MAYPRVSSPADFWKLGDVAFERHRASLVEQIAAVLTDPEYSAGMTWMLMDTPSEFNLGMQGHAHMRDQVRTAPDLRKAIAASLRLLDVSQLSESHARAVGQFTEAFDFARPRTPSLEGINAGMTAFLPLEAAHTDATVAYEEAELQRLMGSERPPTPIVALDAAPVVQKLLEQPDAMRWLMLALPKLQKARTVLGGFATGAGVSPVFTAGDVRDAAEGRRPLSTITGSRDLHELARAGRIVQLMGVPAIHNALVEAFARETAVYDVMASTSAEGRSTLGIIDAVRDPDARRVAHEFVDAFDLRTSMDVTREMQTLPDEFATPSTVLMM